MIDRDRSQPPTLVLRISMALVTSLSIAVSTYLLVGSASGRSSPLVCGPGSSCSRVLTSRWAMVFGFPVSLLAIVANLGPLVAVWGVGSSDSRLQRVAWMAMWVIVEVVAVTAVWFIILQLFVLLAVCYWCMLSHFSGKILAGLVWFSSLVGVGLRDRHSKSHPRRQHCSTLWGCSV